MKAQRNHGLIRWQASVNHSAYETTGFPLEIALAQIIVLNHYLWPCGTLSCSAFCLSFHFCSFSCLNNEQISVKYCALSIVGNVFFPSNPVFECSFFLLLLLLFLTVQDIWTVHWQMCEYNTCYQCHCLWKWNSFETAANSRNLTVKSFWLSLFML